MYETEIAQIVMSSHNAVLVAASQHAASGGTFGAAERAEVNAALLADPTSKALTIKIQRN